MSLDRRVHRLGRSRARKCSARSATRSPFAGSLVLGLTSIICLAAPGSTDQFDDDFTDGIRGSWAIHSNQPLFNWDDGSGAIAFSKPAGGTGADVDYISLVLANSVKGDFDVRVEFSDASLDLINGSIGNQAQLRAVFGSQIFVVVRSDEVGAGHNIHVYAEPPGAWFGALSTSATAGEMRITRIGTTVRGYVDGVQLMQADYGTDDVALIGLDLQNNRTVDPIMVRFDNFSLTADVIGIFADGFESGDTGAWGAVVP